ncbi:MAG: CAP domain-containing protein [Desulfovibrio sp.]
MRPCLALRFEWFAALLLCVGPLLFAGCAPGSGRDSAVNTAPYVSKRAFPDGETRIAQSPEALFQEINRTRVRLGVAPLLPDAQLAALAQRHNAWMIRQGRMSHDGFEQRFALSASGRCVENVSWNYNTPEGVVTGWLESSDHRALLLDAEVTHAGVAFDQGYATLFACRRIAVP